MNEHGTWEHGFVVEFSWTRESEGCFQTKSFYVSMKIFLFSQGSRHQGKTTVPVLIQKIM